MIFSTFTLATCFLASEIFLFLIIFSVLQSLFRTPGLFFLHHCMNSFLWKLLSAFNLHKLQNGETFVVNETLLQNLFNNMHWRNVSLNRIRSRQKRKILWGKTSYTTYCISNEMVLKEAAPGVQQSWTAEVPQVAITSSKSTNAVKKYS